MPAHLNLLPASAALFDFLPVRAGISSTILTTALLPLCPWLQVSDSLQSFICCWELLAQCALVLLLRQLLPPGHPPVHVLFRCDNATAEAASWKGLSTARGLCHVLRFFKPPRVAQDLCVH